MLIKLIALMLLGVVALVQHYRGNIIAGCTWCSISG